MAGTKTMTLPNGEEIDFRLVTTGAGMKEILDLADARDNCEEEAIEIIKRLVVRPEPKWILAASAELSRAERYAAHCDLIRRMMNESSQLRFATAALRSPTSNNWSDGG
jgi:hypothetical protein